MKYTHTVLKYVCPNGQYIPTVRVVYNFQPFSKRTKSTLLLTPSPYYKGHYKKADACMHMLLVRNTCKHNWCKHHLGNTILVLKIIS